MLAGNHGFVTKSPGGRNFNVAVVVIVVITDFVREAKLDDTECYNCR